MKPSFWGLLLLPLLLLAACDGTFWEEEDDEEFSSAPALTNPAGDDYLSQYVAFVAESVTADNIPGVAIAVIEKGEVVLVQGFGYRDVSQRLPVTADTLFHIGSTNKSFTAMLVGTLVEEGVITWDTAVADVYPAFPLDRNITFRHLLNMTSGIPDAAEDDFDIDDSTAEDLLAYLADIELDSAPGKAFSYSNISSSVAGYTAVIAAQADDNGLYDGYITLLQQRILQPIGMNTAVVRVSEAQQSPHYGKSYTIGGNGRPREAEPEDIDGDPLAPSGTLKASAAEMALYIATYLNNGVAPNGTRLISAETITTMSTPYLDEYGLGWQISRIEGYQMVFHDGSFDNYLSVIGFVPDLELGFVVLANSEEAAETLIDNAPQVLIKLFLEQ